VRDDGITSFSMIQMASDASNAAGLVFFLFDPFHLGSGHEKVSADRPHAACITGKRESAMRGAWRFCYSESSVVGEPHSAEASSPITNGA
jgi:hypothetical protein